MRLSRPIRIRGLSFPRFNVCPGIASKPSSKTRKAVAAWSACASLYQRKTSPSHGIPRLPVVTAIPAHGSIAKEIEVVLGDGIYLAKDVLPPALRNRLLRLAAFQNPEFYRAQAMRLPTYEKPRIIACGEDLPAHIGLPRGCLEEILDLFTELKIKPLIRDQRVAGIRWISISPALSARNRKPPPQRCSRTTPACLSATTAFGKTVLAA